MRRGIDSAGQAADHGDPRAGEAGREPFGLLPSVNGAMPGPNDCDGQLIAGFELSATVEHRRCVTNLDQHSRIVGGPLQQQSDPGLAAAFEFPKGGARIAVGRDGGRQFRADSIHLLQFLNAGRENAGR
jgi:hypothetical protein